MAKSKKKQFTTQSNKKGKTSEGPQTVDDYLQSGVEFEEAGEKWRGGDAAKSLRFFDRALLVYRQGLGIFPNSFDLAYNIARLEYEITQQPRLTVQRSESVEELLRTALDSSRVALSLGQDNADVLFNTAQVLTSLAETITDVVNPPVEIREEALSLLEESIELFQRTLTLQEYHLSEAQAQQDAAMNDTTMTDAPSAEAVSSHPGAESSSAAGLSDNKVEKTTQWAEIVEPVTNETLLDTVLAQLQTLATLCGLILNHEGRGITWVEEYASSLLNKKIPEYAKGTDRGAEVAFEKAKFLVAVAEANFRNQRSDYASYASCIAEAFSEISQLEVITETPEVAVTQAEAYMSYNSAVRKSKNNIDLHGAANLRWKALVTALDLLTAATKCSSVKDIGAIHMLRGDVELLRYQMGQEASPYAMAVANSEVLLKNADTYYRGAQKSASGEGHTDRLAIRMYIVSRLRGAEGRPLGQFAAANGALTELEEVVEDGLIAEEWLLQEGVLLRSEG